MHGLSSDPNTCMYK